MADVWGESWLASWGDSWKESAAAVVAIPVPEAAGGGSVERKRTIVNRIGDGLFDGLPQHDDEPENAAPEAAQSVKDAITKDAQGAALQSLTDELARDDALSARRDATRRAAQQKQRKADAAALLAVLEQQERDRIEAARVQDEEEVTLLLQVAQRRRMAALQIIMKRAA